MLAEAVDFAHAPQLQIDLGQVESAVMRDQSRQAPHRLRIIHVGEQEAGGFVYPATNPPAKLVELG